MKKANSLHVYLGFAGRPAKYEYVFSAHVIEQKGRADINSVVPLKNGIKLKFDNLKKA